jgi:hypothetical protein
MKCCPAGRFKPPHGRVAVYTKAKLFFIQTEGLRQGWKRFQPAFVLDIPRVFQYQTPFFLQAARVTRLRNSNGG